jgi:hypothetical protein
MNEHSKKSKDSPQSYLESAYGDSFQARSSFVAFGQPNQQSSRPEGNLTMQVLCTLGNGFQTIKTTINYVRRFQVELPDACATSVTFHGELLVW